jgi:hypothetical protein
MRHPPEGTTLCVAVAVGGWVAVRASGTWQPCLEHVALVPFRADDASFDAVAFGIAAS